MKLSEFKTHLDNLTELSLQLPDGGFVPAHFHITEAGLSTKHFVDCGNTVRTEKAISLQVWVAGDTEHRLAPAKLKKILSTAEPLFGAEDLEVEMEYQTDTIGRYGLEFSAGCFVLQTKHTQCLAQDKCGVPAEKVKVNLADMKPAKTAVCCTLGSGCC